MVVAPWVKYLSQEYDPMGGLAAGCSGGDGAGGGSGVGVHDVGGSQLPTEARKRQQDPWSVKMEFVPLFVREISLGPSSDWIKKCMNDHFQ